MKKVVIIIIIFLNGLSPTLAQINSYGCKFGLNRSNILKNQHQPSNYRNGAFVGVYFDYRIFSLIAIQPEITFIQNGYNTQDYSVALDYFEIPILLKLKTTGMDLYAGLAGAKLIDSRQQFLKLETYDPDNKINFFKNATGLKFGITKYLTFNSNRLSIEARYYRSLKSISKDSDNMINSFSLIVGINSFFEDFSRTNKDLIQVKKEILKEIKYIMTPEEIHDFIAIEKRKDIGEFVENFWKAKDPTPTTSGNEFKDEYYSRLEYANLSYKESKFDGCETDRGRVYILYGPPAEILHENWSNKSFLLNDNTIVHTYEIWLYNKPADNEMSNHIFANFYSGQMRFVFADFHGNGIYKQIFGSQLKETVDPRIFLIP
jgi:GWxTD domain-containing protein